MVYRATAKDIGYINGVMRHEEIYPHISDDLSPEKERLDVAGLIGCPNVYFLIPVVECVRTGLFIFHPWNSVTYEVHTMMLPEHRGEKSIIACREAMRYMFTQTPCHKIVTHVPTYNIPAYALARRVGLKMEGINRKSFLKNGRLYDQYILGICKEEEPCQQ